ncbi:diacylglycerol/lipid kinase family protein [Natranaerobius thermophilus]|uniref:Diacylglycerol kinase catalytic region n=1 Tax=Natranaerobius thermophilus (strain ATCC BAA-1301 / DSM 18059 / JW/NM-WN-LF) TaxID=457570 RepID=B2A5T3_NATTJ|nr:YegS/Rv2252/BmrU family lipid kinase [Natranaerobius thermophilus]ACB84026.1 diacylglycerol kinase catalytic region [Natranaerobius thermophilus JW/NM-WN-LF]
MFLIVYNPKAGHVQSQNLSDLTRKIKERNFQVKSIALTETDFYEQLMDNLTKTRWLISFGGDGTLNTLISYLSPLADEKLPVLIPYPSGTANDFSYQLYGGTPEIEQILTAVEREEYCYLDVGKVNDNYFINVLGAGIFVDVAYKTDSALKQRIGMWAYWFEAIKQIPNFKPITFFIDDGVNCQEIEGYLLLVLNGKGAGGFKSLAPESSLRDGKLDLVVIKESRTLLSLASLFPKILRGDHLDDHRVTYIQKNTFKIKLDNKTDSDVVCVVDGEKGPDFPLEVQVLNQKLPFLHCQY